MAVYRRKAEELAGRKLGLCVNSGLGDPATLVIAPHLTHFCCEVEHHAAKRAVPLHPLWVYKLADGLDRPVTSTAGGWDWAFAAEHKLYGLVRTWIALSYACGHNFMAPQRQWCYTKEKGTHWWETPAVEFAPLYQFVRRHAVLLDGYAAAAQVAVVYDNAARRQGRPTIEPICTALAERNVPFTVVVAGDDWLDYRLDAARLKPFRAVIVAGEPLCDEAQRRVLDSAKSEGRLITWPDQAALEKLVPPQVVVEGDPPVHVQVRVRPQEPTAPAVVHLLNRQYDAAKDAMTVQKQIKVRVRRELLGGRQPARAVLHAPAGEDRNLDLTSDEQSVMFTVPELELWAIVELAGGSQ